jgi:hypothetical protein
MSAHAPRCPERRTARGRHLLGEEEHPGEPDTRVAQWGYGIVENNERAEASPCAPAGGLVT